MRGGLLMVSPAPLKLGFSEFDYDFRPSGSATESHLETPCCGNVGFPFSAHRRYCMTVDVRRV